MRVMQSLRHDVANLDCLPYDGALRFSCCPATAPSPSSHFSISIKAKDAFSAILPVLLGPHDAGHAVVATRCRELRLPPLRRRIRFSCCPAPGTSLSSRFSISIKAKDAFSRNPSSAYRG